MKPKWILIIIILYLSITIAGAYCAALPEKDQPVYVLKVQSPIYHATARFIRRGIQKAENAGAICIIQLDTPGGLVMSMREIIQDMSASKVPVVVYIYPQGGMATSAGAYITYAAHVAAMAPGTHIGSAHPVSLGKPNRRWKPAPTPTPSPTPSKSPESDKKTEEKEDKKKEKSAPKGREQDVGMEKATNAMVALMRSLAEKNGRNVEWAEKAVRESESITADDAVRMNVVEIKAENLHDLIKKLDGREVTLEGGGKVVLHPSANNVKYVEMTGIERFLLIINDPQIAMLLMMLGTLGLYYELSNPGMAVPGIVGGISIIIALYTLGSLPINYTALALIILSMILLLAEIFTPTFGAFTVGAVISFVLGAVFLVPTDIPYLQISRTLIGAVAITMTAFSYFVIKVALGSLKTTPLLGDTGMVGKKVKVKKPLTPEGYVMFEGELWRAWTDGDIIPEGKTVVIEEVKGLKLKVRDAEIKPS